ncbi:class I SAM-dependent methyltransferase [Sulfuricurvum sp.]|uniref:class I SAM-dependent methyltransferase n=2 Tax=Sulfuricurvum sp. TaxID=2025608 RepID=UPI002637AA66|nr:class I SAM-dependent methyltransferase [Sulfuricurvum sp.]MDD3596410.1 class I SAM-dependent methyltransferase [Sulfuricurvum sp.]
MPDMIKQANIESSVHCFCPICKNTDIQFRPLPDFYRIQAEKHGYQYFGQGEMTAHETYSCSKCGASDRERLYGYWLEQKLQTCSTKLNILHIAPESGLSTLLQKQSCLNYKTADLMMDNVDYKIDMMAMPIEDNSIDCFICSHVLEHVENDDKAMKELYRILSPGGWGILMVPICTTIEHTLEDASHISEAERWKHYGQNDHVRLYAHDDYVKKIKEHGFKLTEYGEEYFGIETFKGLGLKQTSILYIVEKYD